jgi:hypothetical protein
MNTSQLVTLDQALDAVMLLPFDQQDALVDIVRQRRIEAKREEWAREAERTLEAYRQGEIKAMTAEEIIAELHKELESDEQNDW